MTHNLQLNKHLPRKNDEVVKYLRDATPLLHAQIEEIHRSFFVETHAEPSKRHELMIRFADGTDWNPGFGRGLYQYSGGAWKKILFHDDMWG
jgi:hypothetical protein